MVFARRRAGNCHSVLSGPSATDEARTQTDARGRRRDRHGVHAHPASRSRPRARQRVSFAFQTSLARIIWFLHATLPGLLQAKTQEPQATCCTSPAWYAQAHPAEDFAETFAVWLTPRSNWRRRYKGWPALRKLEYIDEVMKELAGTRPRNRTRTKVETLSAIKITLARALRAQARALRLSVSGSLRARICAGFFRMTPAINRGPALRVFLRSIRREVRQIVADGTGVHQYTIDHVYGEYDRAAARN